MAKQIDKIEISDALIERPIGFTYRRRHFSIYPPTLGKIQLISRLLEKLGLDKLDKGADMYVALLRAAALNRDICKRILAYSTLNGDSCLDEKKVEERIRKFRWIRESDLASILLIALTMDHSEEILENFGLDKEAERLSKAMKAKKKNKNSLYFAGKSIWGTMIDAACERYGWTYQYVLWDISYCALKLLLADQLKTVFISDEERKRGAVSSDQTVISADSPETLERFIKSTSWS